MSPEVNREEFVDGRCSDCRSEVIRNERYDAYFCETCDEWLEEICSDGCKCGFCKDRPEKPSQVKKN